MVSVLAFYFDDPSSNPADNYHFSVNILFEKNENKQKEAWVGPFFNMVAKELSSKTICLRRPM